MIQDLSLLVRQNQRKKKTLESKILKCISTKQTFKCGSKILKVSDITGKHIYSLIKQDIPFMSVWNYRFEGDARISVPTENGFQTDVKSICGYVRIEDNEVLEIFKEIQVK